MDAKDWALLLLLSFLWGGSFFLIDVYIGAGLAAIINASTPLFTVLIAGAFLVDEHMTPQKVIGVLVGLFGVGVLIGADAFAELGFNMSLTTFAQLAILGAAISYGCASVFGRRFITAATIILLPMSYIVERPDQLANPSLVTGLAIVCLGVFCTALGYLLYFRILSSSGATNVVLVTFLVPVTAAFLGWLILGEQLHGRYVTGMVLIGLGLAAIDGRPWEKLRAVLR